MRFLILIIFMVGLTASSCFAGPIAQWADTLAKTTRSSPLQRAQFQLAVESATTNLTPLTTPAVVRDLIEAIEALKSTNTSVRQMAPDVLMPKLIALLEHAPRLVRAMARNLVLRASKSNEYDRDYAKILCLIVEPGDVIAEHLIVKWLSSGIFPLQEVIIDTIAERDAKAKKFLEPISSRLRKNNPTLGIQIKRIALDILVRRHLKAVHASDQTAATESKSQFEAEVIAAILDGSPALQSIAVTSIDSLIQKTEHLPSAPVFDALVKLREAPIDIQVRTEHLLRTAGQKAHDLKSIAEVQRVKVLFDIRELTPCDLYMGLPVLGIN